MIFLTMAVACQKKDSATSEKSAPLEKWNNLSEVSKDWIQLERDTDGYLIYDPCDGDTPRLKIDSGRIDLYFRLDDPYKFGIDKYTRTLNSKGLMVFGIGKFGTVTANAKIVDPKNKLVLWTFEINDKQLGNSEFKWVMTPKSYEKEFRHVDNPCPTEKISEKVFLPIEFK